MDNERAHRKRVKHYNEPGHAHLLTFSCYQRKPLLTNDRWRTELSLSIDRATEAQTMRLVAFVYMPEHVHLLAWPRKEEYSISRFLKAVKRPCSYRIRRWLEEHNSPLVAELTVRERPGKRAFRFWQEGGGHDRNFRTIEGVMSAAEYMHNNPVRRGLCETPGEWLWSSWRHYHRADQPPSPGLPKVHGLLPR